MTYDDYTDGPDYYPRYSHMIFSHCRDGKYKSTSEPRDYHGYCKGHFTNGRGRQVFCACECHQPPEVD